MSTFVVPEAAAAYLGAMIDGEGSVRKMPRRGVSISNTDLDIIEACTEALREIGVQKWSVTTVERAPVQHNTCYTIDIWRIADLRLIFETCPIASKEKRRRLFESLIDRKHEGNGSRRCEPGCQCGRHRKAA